LCKIAYRLAKTSGLSIGLFTTVSPGEARENYITFAPARPVDIAALSDRRCVLVAHILATLTENSTVKDEDMAIPPDWKTAGTKSKVGHNVLGRTIALHSLSVLPELQGARIGSTILRAYIQMMKDAHNFDRIAILTWERLVPWYESFGFEIAGKSAVKYGGEEWVDMVRLPLLLLSEWSL